MNYFLKLRINEIKYIHQSAHIRINLQQLLNNNLASKPGRFKIIDRQRMFTVTKSSF